MKTILCYGDSNTWGYIPGGKGRYPYSIRWTGVLQNELGSDYKIIEEGLNGRTTVFDDPIEGGFKSGLSYLTPCLETHKPLDLVILMLGTNDLKRRFALSAQDISQGVARLTEIVLKSDAGVEGKAPEVLIVSPIQTGDMKHSCFSQMFDPQTCKTVSKQLAYYYQIAAQTFGCYYLDAAQFAMPSDIDALHMTAEGHHRLGRAIALKVHEILQVQPLAGPSDQ